MEVQKIKNKNVVQKDTDIVTKIDLASREIFFSKINFTFDKWAALKKAKDGVVRLALNTSLRWQILAKKKDKKGILIGCDFKIKSEPFKANIFIEVKMEFKKIISGKQVFNSYFFQQLAAHLFFPYLVELVAANTGKLDPGSSPLILDKRIFDQILRQTKEQGYFKKEEQSPPKK